MSHLDSTTPRRRSPRGFTLIELSVVLVVLGIVASFVVGRFHQLTERTRAAEAVSYLANLRLAQEQYMAFNGTYAPHVDALALELGRPRLFSVGDIEPPDIASTLELGWQLTLTRQGPASGYGTYTVTFDQDGFAPAASTIPPEINPLLATGQDGSGSSAAASSSSGSAALDTDRTWVDDWRNTEDVSPGDGKSVTNPEATSNKGKKQKPGRHQRRP